MARIRSLKDLENFNWTGSDLIGSLTEGAHLFLFAYSPDMQALAAWSANAESVLGVPDTTIMRDGNLFLRHVHPDDRFLLMTDLENALAGKDEYRATYRWIRPDTNEVRWLHCRASLIERDGKNIFEGVIIDLSDEITGPVSRVAGPDSLATILDAFSTTVIVLDSDLRVLRVNRKLRACEFNFGDPEFQHDQFRIGRLFLPCFTDTDQRTHLQHAFTNVLSGEQQSFKTRISEEQTVFQLAITPVKEHGTISGVLLTVSDISEFVSLEQRISELQKTEGLRLIAAGVSHNFNNALQSIIGHAAVIQNHASNEELTRESSQAIIDIVNKTSELSKQLHRLDTSGGEVVAPVEVNLAVMAAVNKIEDLFATGAKITVVFGSPTSVLARQEELAYVIEAIVRNARERLDNTGNIAIKTQQVILAEYEVQDLKQGRYAKLSISDTGPGMTPDTIKRCMDPFFTTVDSDPGTGVGLKRHGLGLSGAFSTIRKFGGAITVDSVVGKGTTISLFLPSEDQGYRTAGKESELTDVVVKNPHVLIIDDDRMVLETVHAILTDIKVTCVCAEDGHTGLTLLRAHRSSIKAVLLDAIMPGVSGAALVKRLKKVAPEIPVIGFSGAPPDVTQPMLDAGAERILSKPVGARQLKEAIETCLKAKKAA